MNQKVVAKSKLESDVIGTGLQPDNRIITLFKLEEQLMPREARKAYGCFITLLSSIKFALAVQAQDRLREKPMTLQEKILCAYDEMLVQGYSFAIAEGNLITRYLLAHKLNAESSAFVILALADELKQNDPAWEKVALVLFPDHLVVEVEGTYIDTGYTRSKAFYQKQFGLYLPEKELRRLLQPYKDAVVISLFYDYRGFERFLHKDLQGGLEDLNQALTYRENSPQAYCHRAIIRHELGDLDGARSDYTRAIQLNKNYVDAFFNRGRLKAIQIDLKGALKDFNRAIELKPKAALAYITRAKVYFQLNDFPKAIADLEQAIRLHTSDPNAFFMLGVARKKVGSANSALVALEQARVMNPKDFRILASIGQVYHEMGNISAALTAYEEAVRLSPDNPLLLNEVGELFQKFGRFPEAIDYFKTALKLAPDFEQAQRNLAQSLM